MAETKAVEAPAAAAEGNDVDEKKAAGEDGKGRKRRKRRERNPEDNTFRVKGSKNIRDAVIMAEIDDILSRHNEIVISGVGKAATRTVTLSQTLVAEKNMTITKVYTQGINLSQQRGRSGRPRENRLSPKLCITLSK